MQHRLGDFTPRAFDPAAFPGLPAKAQDAARAVFDAMSTWRLEASATSEKNSRVVIEKMTAAAAALGWPQPVVDAARGQMQSMADMQTQTIDHIIGAWEEQLKLPNPTTESPSAMLSRLKSGPTLGSSGMWPTNAFQMAGVNPLQFWMQCAAQWQRSWTDAMALWAKTGTAGNAGLRMH